MKQEAHAAACRALFLKKTSLRGGIVSPGAAMGRKGEGNLPQRSIQEGEGLSSNVPGNAINGLGKAARDGGESVAVPAERYGVADGILEAFRLQEGDNGLRNGALTAHIEPVRGSYVIQPEIQIVIPRQGRTDLR